MMDWDVTATVAAKGDTVGAQISTLKSKRILLRLVPFDETADALVQRHIGLIANLLFQMRGVGIGHIHVTRLHRFHDHLRLDAQGILYLVDKVHELDGVGTADIIHTERHTIGTIFSHWWLVQTLQTAIGDIMAIGEVAHHVAMVKHIDRLTL